MPSMEEIERIWFELQREMTASGKVVRVPSTVINANGEAEQRDVVRVGLFNAVADGKYLEYIPETKRLIELQRQPQSRYTGRAEDLEEATSGLHSFAIDPTRGQLLSLLVQSPSLMERIAQGKIVGYVIITIGIIGLLIALWRMLALSATSAKVNRQMKNLDRAGNNPLGRVIKIAHDNPNVDVEGLELKPGRSHSERNTEVLLHATVPEDHFSRGAFAGTAGYCYRYDRHLPGHNAVRRGRSQADGRGYFNRIGHYGTRPCCRHPNGVLTHTGPEPLHAPDPDPAGRSGGYVV